MKVNVSKSKVIALFVEMGFTVAPRWKDDRILKRLQELPAKYADETVSDQKFFNKLVKDVSAGHEIVLTDSDNSEEEEEATPAKKVAKKRPAKKVAKKRPAKKVAEPEPSEEDDEEEAADDGTVVDFDLTAGDESEGELTEDAIRAMSQDEIVALAKEKGIKRPKEIRTLARFKDHLIAALFAEKKVIIEEEAKPTRKAASEQLEFENMPVHKTLPPSRPGSNAHRMSALLSEEWIDEEEVVEKTGFTLDQVRTHFAYLKEKDVIEKKVVRSYRVKVN